MQISTETTEGIAVVTMSSDDGLNILSLAALRDLAGKLLECEEERTTRGIVIQSSGRTFSAGADIDEFPYGEDAYRFLHEVLHLIATPERIGKPVVAAIEASAVAAGLELALACDWIVATDDSKMSLPEVAFGFVPGYSLSRLPQLVGHARARRVMLDPGPFSAEEMRSFGIHLSTVARGAVLEEAVRICAQMATGPVVSIRTIKGLTNRYGSADFETVIGAYNGLFTRPEAKEGFEAFKDGRKPNYWS